MNRENALMLLFVFCASIVNAQKVIQLYTGKAPGSENWNWLEMRGLSTIK